MIKMNSLFIALLQLTREKGGGLGVKGIKYRENVV